MNEVAVSEKLVTTKELAEELGVDKSTITRTLETMPDLVANLQQAQINGKSGYIFNVAQATAVKVALQNKSRIAKNGFDTLTISNDLEMMLMQQRLNEYQSRRIAELQAENKKQKAVIDRIANGKGCFTMNQAAKALKLPYGNIKLFERLRGEGVLNSDNSPKQEQTNAGHFNVVVKHVNDKVGNKSVTLVTGKGLVYLAKRLNTEIDPAVIPDAE